jgi:hypothetical protein
MQKRMEAMVHSTLLVSSDYSILWQSSAVVEQASDR